MKIENMEAYVKGAVSQIPLSNAPGSWMDTGLEALQDGFERPTDEYGAPAAVRSYAQGEVDFHNAIIVPHNMLKKNERPVHFLDRVKEEQAELKKLRAQVKRLEKQSNRLMEQLTR